MKKKRLIRKTKRFLKEQLYLFKNKNSTPGSVGWLVKTEIKYGGLHTGVKRNKVSLHDPRSADERSIGGMRGGDRMLHHRYADKYAAYLRPFISKTEKILLVEVGILKGTGLAIWSDLFINARIIGLDIDLGHIKDNMVNLKKLGAFKNNNIELYEFDQFQNNSETLEKILKKESVDIFIDDGFHSNEAILNMLKYAVPHLSKKFVYFIEDNKNVHHKIKTLYPNLKMDVNGQLTVLFS